MLFGIQHVPRAILHSLGESACNESPATLLTAKDSLILVFNWSTTLSWQLIRLRSVLIEQKMSDELKFYPKSLVKQLSVSSIDG